MEAGKKMALAKRLTIAGIRYTVASIDCSDSLRS
jgi:hypothetical protein